MEHKETHDEETSSTPFTVSSEKTETSRYKKDDKNSPSSEYAFKTEQPFTSIYQLHGAGSSKSYKHPESEIMHIVEAFFETLACFKYTSAVLGTFLVVLYLLSIALDAISFVTRFSQKTNVSPGFYGFRWLLIMPFFMGTAYLTIIPIPCKYKSRRHFSHLGTNEKRGLIGILITFLIYIVLVLMPGILIWDMLAIITVILRSLLTLVMAFVNAQRATKLRFDPTKKNRNFPNISTISKTKGQVEILESSAFRITLKNVGNETWNSEHFQVHRHLNLIYVCYCVELKLPSFTLLPQEQIDLVPEKHSFDGKCVRIPRVHCFGIIDRGIIAKTFVADARTKIRFMKEDDGLCTHQTKAAEFIAQAVWKDTEWPKVTVNETS